MKGLRLALFVSVAANLLLLGVIGGAALSNARQEKVATESAVARAPNVRAVLEALPPERRRVVRDAVITAVREGRPARIEARRLRREAHEIASRDPYDPAAVKAAFARARDADAVVVAQVQDTLAEAMSSLSAEERRAVLERLAQRRGAIAARNPFRSPPEEAPGVEP